MRNLKSGKAYCYGDDVDTDVIIPARYLNTSDPNELKSPGWKVFAPIFQIMVKEIIFFVQKVTFGAV